MICDGGSKRKTLDAVTTNRVSVFPTDFTTATWESVAPRFQDIRVDNSAISDTDGYRQIRFSLLFGNSLSVDIFNLLHKRLLSKTIRCKEEAKTNNYPRL